MIKQANITLSQIVEVKIDRRMTDAEFRDSIFTKVKKSIEEMGIDKWLDEHTVEFDTVD